MLGVKRLGVVASTLAARHTAVRAKCVANPDHCVCAQRDNDEKKQRDPRFSHDGQHAPAPLQLQRATDSSTGGSPDPLPTERLTELKFRQEVMEFCTVLAGPLGRHEVPHKRHFYQTPLPERSAEGINLALGVGTMVANANGVIRGESTTPTDSDQPRCDTIGFGLVQAAPLALRDYRGAPGLPRRTDHTDALHIS